jgi:hypothetical protein
MKSKRKKGEKEKNKNKVAYVCNCSYLGGSWFEANLSK